MTARWGAGRPRHSSEGRLRDGDGRGPLVCRAERAHTLCPGGPHLEGRLPRQALVHDGADAPQVRLPVVVLGHDDLRGLRGYSAVGATARTGAARAPSEVWLQPIRTDASRMPQTWRETVQARRLPPEVRPRDGAPLGTREGTPPRTPLPTGRGSRGWGGPPTMYMGEPQSVAAIMLLCRYRAKPKSAAGEERRERGGRGPRAPAGLPGPRPPPHRS